MIVLRRREAEYFDLRVDGYSKDVACDVMGITTRHVDALTYTARKRNGFGRDTDALIYAWRMQQAGYPLDWWQVYRDIRPKLVKVGDME